MSFTGNFPPRILVFDSGLGGLSVYAELRKARPDAQYLYLADDAVFPYGSLSEGVLVARVMALMDEHIAQFKPDLVVIACNTASTLVLPPLRARFYLPFVGTVPAIKPAARLTRSGCFSVLATPATVMRDYTHDLIRAHAADCKVTLVGAKRLATLAEAHLRGEPVSDEEIAREIRPAFVEDANGRTDVIVLACTHYPLLLEALKNVAPWEVTWIDPAEAIARQAANLLHQIGVGQKNEFEQGVSVFTSRIESNGFLRQNLLKAGLKPAHSIKTTLLSPKSGIPV